MLIREKKRICLFIYLFNLKQALCMVIFEALYIIIWREKPLPESIIGEPDS